jgi:hypothetical protein
MNNCDHDGRLGMTWWNALTSAERIYWMDVAGNTGVAADAWAAFKYSAPRNVTPDWREARA